MVDTKKEIQAQAKPSQWERSDPIKRLLKVMIQAPRKRVIFFTVKGDKKWDRPDRVRKWLRQFSNKYIFVQSPKGGIHYHGLALVDAGRSIRYCRGIHMRISPIGQSSAAPPSGVVRTGHEAIRGRDADPHHPVIEGKVGKQLMKVCREIDGYKSPLRVRIKGRKARLTFLKTQDAHINRCVDYLVKNLNENVEPCLYQHLNIKL